ncbi:MAG: hypothetical protein FJY95_09260 [Candidatus Handelsmanbacteria bacterium]|nr:hypothetical protein [Candidatus Handelsmanbacteria bacterium]
MPALHSAVGYAVLLALAYRVGRRSRHLPWKTILIATLLQVAGAALLSPINPEMAGHLFVASLVSPPAAEGMQLFLNIAGLLIAFIGMVALGNAAAQALDKLDQRRGGATWPAWGCAPWWPAPSPPCSPAAWWGFSCRNLETCRDHFPCPGVFFP